MTYDILATGSTGNAVVINDEILVDCGVPYKTLSESGYVPRLRLVLLTHKHGDHFNPSTARRLHQERPALRWGGCEWMVPTLLDAGINKAVIDVYEPWHAYAYVSFSFAPVPLIHDVPNCGYKLNIGGGRRFIFYATDTASLDGIEAKNYDLYLIEANHTRAEIEARMEEKLSRGEFAYEYRAAQNHLSQEQAMDWLAQNMGPKSKYLFLHQHKEEEDRKT